MKKTLTIFFLFLFAFVPLKSKGQQTTRDSGSPSLARPSAEVVTLLGSVEVLNREGREITIDGKKFPFSQDLVVTKAGGSVTVNELSEDDFVVATIKEGVVTEISIAPPGTVE